MSLYQPGPPALNDASSYQVSSKPFFKGEIVADNVLRSIEFPAVTNWIHIRNSNVSRTNDGPRISFSENGQDTNNYFVSVSSPSVQDTSPQILYVKVTKLYYKSNTGGNQSFDVIAGLTNIPTGSLTNNWSGSVGVG